MRDRLPPPWVATGWHGRHTVEWSLFIPGIERVRVSRLSHKQPWSWHGTTAHVLDISDGKVKYAPHVGPFTRAQEAAIEAENYLAVAMRSGLRRLTTARALAKEASQ